MHDSITDYRVDPRRASAAGKVAGVHAVAPHLADVDVALVTGHPSGKAAVLDLTVYAAAFTAADSHPEPNKPRRPAAVGTVFLSLFNAITSI